MTTQTLDNTPKIEQFFLCKNKTFSEKKIKFSLSNNHPFSLYIKYRMFIVYCLHWLCNKCSRKSGPISRVINKFIKKYSTFLVTIHTPNSWKTLQNTVVLYDNLFLLKSIGIIVIHLINEFNN